MSFSSFTALLTSALCLSREMLEHRNSDFTVTINNDGFSFNVSVDLFMLTLDSYHCSYEPTTSGNNTNIAADVNKTTSICKNKEK